MVLMHEHTYLHKIECPSLISITTTNYRVSLASITTTNYRVSIALTGLTPRPNCRPDVFPGLPVVPRLRNYLPAEFSYLYVRTYVP